MTWSSARFGAYRTESTLGEGAMGVVLRCRNADTGAIVALKVASAPSESHNRAILREFAALQRLNRASVAGIVQAIEWGTSGGRNWYAMEHVLGRALREEREALWVRHRLGSLSAQESRTLDLDGEPARGARPAAAELWSGEPPLKPAAAGQLPRVLGIVQKLAEALSGIHAAGIVHGDLTPANVLLREGDEPVLVDFGTALYGYSWDVSREILDLEERHRGTPGFLAPECLAGGARGVRCDLYALGCILYELLTGTPPFAHASGLAADLYRGLPKAPSRRVAGVPPSLDELTLGLLEPDPRRRVGFARDVAVALAQLTGRPAAGSARSALFRAPMLAQAEYVDGIERLLFRAQRRMGALVVVAGQRGAGKTRALIEAGHRAERRGFAVHIARGSDANDSCAVFGTAQPLAPFVPLLAGLSRMCADAPSGGLAKQVRASLECILAHDPSLRQPLGALEVVERADAPSEQQLFQAVQRCLIALAAVQPLALMLDDLDLAGGFAIRFFSSAFAPGLLRHPILVVMAFQRTPPAFKVAEELVLAPLSALDVSTMIQEMLGAELIPPGLGDLVSRRAGGNPFFVAEMLRSAVARGALVRGADGRWRFPEASESGVTRDSVAPEDMRGIFEPQLQSLTREHARILAFGALLGNGFSIRALDVLAACARRFFPGSFEPELEVPANMAHLDDLVARGILRERADGEYSFVHGGVHELCYETLSKDVRLVMHRVAARYLARQWCPRMGPERLACIGQHLANAQYPRRAYVLLTRAAQLERARHALNTAIEHLERAEQQLERMFTARAFWPVAAVEAMDALPTLLVHVARHQDAVRCLARFVERLAPTEHAQRACLSCRQARPLRLSGRIAEVGAVLVVAEREAALLSDADERNLWTLEVQLLRAETAYYARKDTALMARALDQGEPLTAEASPSQRSRFFLWSANALALREDYAFSLAAVNFERRAVAELEGESSQQADAIMARFDLAFMLLLGDREHCREASGILQAAARDADALAEVTLLARTETYLALAHRKLHEPDWAEAAAERGRLHSAAAGMWGYLAACRANLAWVAWRRGQQGKAELLARAACHLWWRSRPEPDYEPREEFPFQWIGILPLVAACSERGDPSEAAELVLELLRPAQQRLPPALDALLRETLAERVPQRLQTRVRAVVRCAVEHGYL